MTVRLVPAYVQGVAGDPPRSSNDDRNVLYGLTGGGQGVLTVAGVTLLTAGPGLAVQVSAFDAVVAIPSTKRLRGGSYHVYNDGTITRTVGPAPGTGTARLDWLGIRVRDREFTASGDTADDADVIVIAGTAAGTPVLPSLTGQQGTLYQLATLRTNAGATTPIVTPTFSPWPGSPQVEWHLSDDTSRNAVNPGATATYTHPQKVRMYSPAYLAGLVSVHMRGQNEYFAVDYTFTVGGIDLPVAAGFGHPYGDGVYSTAGSNIDRDWMTVPVLSAAPIPAGLHSHVMTFAVSAGSLCEASMDGWILQVRPVLLGHMT
jgi:hypothetical protein